MIVPLMFVCWGVAAPVLRSRRNGRRHRAQAGLLLARLRRTWPALAAFLLGAIVATVGWVVAAARPVVDCDENETFCAERYG